MSFESQLLSSFNPSSTQNATAEFVSTVQLVRECRDQKDNKFPEVALNGRADMIITGDADLLEMNPWRGVAILSPTEYADS